MQYRNIYKEIGEDLIEVMGDSFMVWLLIRLPSRSRELPTSATSEQLLKEVCEYIVRGNFEKLQTFRTAKFGACHMTHSEIVRIAEALQPLCQRAFIELNVHLSVHRDDLFQPRDYTEVAGRLFFEEAPSVTFVRFLNDMQRLKEVRSETYERNISRIAEVHALNRVANVMPKEFHAGFDGWRKPGQSIDAAKWAEREATVAWFSNKTGIRTKEDLLDRAGLA